MGFRIFGTMAFAFCVAVAMPAWADERADLEKSRNAYLARQYGEAAERLRGLLDPDKGTLKDRALVSQGRMLLGASLFAMKQTEEASQIFERLLLDDPLFEPDPLSFPTDVVNAFIDTRERIRELLRQAAEVAARRDAERRARVEAEKRRQADRMALLERLAKEERVVERHSRFVAALPFGVGQFQNGQRVLGWVFLSTELACIAVGAAAFPFYVDELRSASEAYQARDLQKAQQYLDRASTLRRVNLVSYGAFAVTALTGIAHAQWTFVPEKSEVRPRTTPPLGLNAPTLVPLRAAEGGTHGWMMGLSGTF